MEPQAAVAVPDEGGMMTVHCATQSLDVVQGSVATALGVPQNHITAGVCSHLLPPPLPYLPVPKLHSMTHPYMSIVSQPCPSIRREL